LVVAFRGCMVSQTTNLLLLLVAPCFLFASTVARIPFPSIRIAVLGTFDRVLVHSILDTRFGKDS
jgi:hypothetical protein